MDAERSLGKNSGWGLRGSHQEGRGGGWRWIPKHVRKYVRAWQQKQLRYVYRRADSVARCMEWCAGWGEDRGRLQKLQVWGRDGGQSEAPLGKLTLHLLSSRSLMHLKGLRCSVEGQSIA